MENYDETFRWKDWEIDNLRSRAETSEIEKARADAAEARVAELEAGINELLDSGRFYRSAFEFDFSIDGEEIGAKLKALAGRKDG